MRLLTKIITETLPDTTAFTYLNGQPYLVGFQEIRTPVINKLKGFFIECYEHKNSGKMVGYLYATVKDKTLIFDEKEFVRNNPYIQECTRLLEIKIPRMWRNMYSLFGLKITNAYSAENENRLPHQKGFGKFLVKKALDIGRNRYQLEKLEIHSTIGSMRFYYHIFKIPFVLPKTFGEAISYPLIQLDLSEALQNMNSGAGVPKGEPK